MQNIYIAAPIKNLKIAGGTGAMIAGAIATAADEEEALDDFIDRLRADKILREL
ncbi:hypothetical protein [Fictibacillus macauensis]|uniref:hypothetical protein n=1 Tax=Fictibacillus macauensis TaxID=245160 RepID=UPI0002D5AD26|nr:hypothetical protein [Fictibacillus macauensis]